MMGGGTVYTHFVDARVYVTLVYFWDRLQIHVWFKYNPRTPLAGHGLQHLGHVFFVVGGLKAVVLASPVK